MNLFTFTQICYIALFAFPVEGSRNYDIESESMRLYGEDFVSALTRFRRTSEYLKILEDRYEVLQTRLQEVVVQTMQHIENKLAKKIADLVGYPTSTPTTSDPSLAYYKVRRSDDYTDKLNMDEVKKLDNYHTKRQTVSTHDRNRYREIGFEMAGQMVDLIIKGMGPIKSWDEPVDETGTTEASSIHDHEVHSDTPTTMSPEEETTIATSPENLRFKKGHKY